MTEIADDDVPAAAPARVRSYVRRGGRITVAQRRALRDLWPVYGVDDARPEALARALRKNRPWVLEIGFGDGEALLAAARRDPGRDYLGIEVHEPGIGHVLNVVASERIDNVRLLRGDAAELLGGLPEGVLAEAWVFFPDPWPKKRHHKRRLIAPRFVAELARRLAPGGQLLMATDWEDYALAMLAVGDGESRLRNAAGPGAFSPRPSERPTTKFERRGHRLGHRIWDLAYVRSVP